MAQTKKVRGVATKVFEDDTDKIVKYHNTEVVRFNKKRIKLDTGGYDTKTTRRRMNQASNEFKLGYRVYTKNGETLVDFDGLTIRFTGNVLELER